MVGLGKLVLSVPYGPSPSYGGTEVNLVPSVSLARRRVRGWSKILWTRNFFSRDRSDIFPYLYSHRERYSFRDFFGANFDHFTRKVTGRCTKYTAYSGSYIGTYLICIYAINEPRGGVSGWKCTYGYPRDHRMDWKSGEMYRYIGTRESVKYLNLWSFRVRICIAYRCIEEIGRFIPL